MSSIYLPEIAFEIETDVIQATNRKLKAVWTMEAQDDLNSQHNIPAADELAAIMAKEIMEELDKEILEDLRNMAEEAKREEYRQKNKKKKILPRSITDEWEVSRFD